jgi:large subunit ribosomal protein L18
MKNLKTLRKANPTRAQRIKRAIGVRKRISGTADRPRLSVFRSAKHVYVQAIDDESGRTLAAASTVDKEITVDGLKKTDAAKKVGELVGKRLNAQGVESAVFDRNGFRYHGRVAAVADGAREAGLKF